MEEQKHLQEDARVFQRKIFSGLGVLVIQLLLLVAAFIFGYYSQKKLATLSERRYQSFLLADELRQSSDDLTRMVRTYIVTGDKRYQKNFYKILGIRSGEHPRPINYQRPYWDVIRDSSYAEKDTLPVRKPFFTLLEESGFVESELDLLHESESYSDELVNLEEEAMHAIDGKFKDSEGRYTITGRSNRDYALSLLFGKEYHAAKSRIMTPIAEFFETFENRTKREVDQQESRVLFLIALLAVLFCSIGANIYYIFRQGKYLQNFLVSGLQQIVAEQTRAISEQNRVLMASRGEIETKNRMLSDKNEELEQYAYVTSHDLQEPLRKIKNFSELLLSKSSEKLDDKEVKYLSYIIDGAVRMQQLINDLLLFSRITSRGGNFEDVDLNTVVKRAMDTLSLLITESNAVITPEKLPGIKGDQLQLTQLFQNLIGNALKYRKPGIPPEVKIFTTQKDDKLVFAVQDNGIGFEMEFAQRIFQVFQRLHTHSEYKGTGIGLSICKRIVSRHNGRLWAESEPGKGATFYFTLGEVGGES